MKLNVLKSHYFLWFGCLSGILPVVPVFAKSHTIATASYVGILYCILPFVASVAKPTFCSIADRYHAHKKVLIVFLFLTLVGYGLLLTVPVIDFGIFSWYYFCLLVLLANSSMGVVISLTDCLVMKEVTKKNRNYGHYRVFGTMGWGAMGLFAGVINENISKEVLPYLVPGLLMFLVIETIDVFIIWTKFKEPDENENENKNSNANVGMISDDNLSDKKLNEEENNTQNKNTAWNMKGLNALLETFSEVYAIFRNHPSLIQYTALVNVFGILTAFHWSFYFWFVEELRGKDPLLMGLCLFVQCFIGEIPFFMISNKILNICGPAISLNLSLLAFAIRYFAYGYLLRTGDSYWDVLLIEVSQGPTFSLFYCVMTFLGQHYAEKASDPKNIPIIASEAKKINDAEVGEQEIEEKKKVDCKKQDTCKKQNTHATMQGIMSGCYEGLGLGIGSLIGGIAIDALGVFYIWRYAAFFAVGTVIVNTIIEIIKNMRRTVGVIETMS